jgi:hypothetical protein
MSSQDHGFKKRVRHFAEHDGFEDERLEGDDLEGTESA